VSTGTPNRKCFYIDLSPALTVGGGTIVPQIGIISSGTCTGLTNMADTINLELEVTYFPHSCLVTH